MWAAILFLYALLTYIEGVQVAVNLQSRPGKNAMVEPEPPEIIPADPVVARRRALAIVFCGGINLILIQWILVRELSTLLLGTELVVLLVSIAYFAGISLGYLISHRLRPAWFLPLAITTLVMHLTLPVWLRLMAAGLDAGGMYPLAFILLPLLTVLVVPAFYSMFLPFFAQTSVMPPHPRPLPAGQGGEHKVRAVRLPLLYTLELLGAVGGVLLLVITGGIGLQAVLAVYAIVLLAMVYLLSNHRIKRPNMARHVPAGMLAAVCAGWILVFPAVNAWSNALWYQQIKQLPEGTQTLYTAYSPYQKIDVLESPDGRRYLYLDGLQHFGSDSGTWLNIIMGQIPAQILQPKTALVIGAGSMEMERMIAQAGNSAVTTVEIDPLVVDAGMRFFEKYNFMNTLTGRTIVIDDAKHFLANTDAMYHLVATDTPAAFSLQTATLYSEPFYRLIEARLASGGVLVANLTDTFERENTVARRISASLLAVYDEVMVVTSGSAGWSFAFAADKLPFTRQEVEHALRTADETEYVLFETGAVREIVGDAKPITLDTMDIVLEISAAWIKDRLQ